MQVISWHHKLFHFHLLFESEKCGKEGKKSQKFEYLENENNFLDYVTNFTTDTTQINSIDADIKSKVAYIDSLILTLNIENSRLIANCLYIKLNKTKNCASELRKQKKVESKKG